MTFALQVFLLKMAKQMVRELGHCTFWVRSRRLHCPWLVAKGNKWCSLNHCERHYWKALAEITYRWFSSESVFTVATVLFSFKVYKGHTKPPRNTMRENNICPLFYSTFFLPDGYHLFFIFIYWSVTFVQPSKLERRKRISHKKLEFHPLSHPYPMQLAKIKKS